MKIAATKGALKVLEASEHPGMDQILSLMSSLVDDVYEETGDGIHKLNMVTRKGNEEGFLNALYNVSAELSDIMADIDADQIPEELRVFADHVSGAKDEVQRLADITAQWKNVEKECLEMSRKIAEEEQKLEEQKNKLKELESERKRLEEERADAGLTEKECQDEITKLQKEIAELPQSNELAVSRNLVKGQRKRYNMVRQYVSEFIHDHSEGHPLRDKFELAEDACKKDLETVDSILGNLEKHYGMMLEFMERERKERESIYAGN